MMREPIDATGMTLRQVLDALGWYTTPSTIEGRRRIYSDEGLLVNVCNPAETWALLEEQGLVVRRKEIEA